MFYIVFMAVLVIVFGVTLTTALNKEVKDVDARPTAGLVATACAVIALVWTGLDTIMVVSVGEAKVLSVFGTVNAHVYQQGGPYIVNPLASSEAMDVRQRNIDFKSGGDDSDDAKVVSSNNLVLTIDVTYQYALNPQYAWIVYKLYGDDDTYNSNLMVPAAANATRNAVAEFTSDEATTTKREQLRIAMADQFQDLLVANLMKFGISKEVAEQVFIVLPVQLRKALPPGAVLQAIENKVAAQQDLERQQTLTAIAAQVAFRRKQEGIGVAQLFDALPKGFSPTEISVVLNALATKERADALTAAVDKNRLGMTVFGADPQVAVTPPQGK